ncbi:hypothetical protein F7D09_1331 [Bifidobacterium leontopitheci]|uniref:Uncharacterized protein n=1 Tax=Bifidobacterium leontopitheci TaxID=2650774 RepID=A0A6I1GPX4_9BIFI|nr:hypothetical protein F7D09_1331 [Bifidobacterium leontopitheci]
MQYRFPSRSRIPHPASPESRSPAPYPASPESARCTMCILGKICEELVCNDTRLCTSRRTICLLFAARCTLCILRKAAIAPTATCAAQIQASGNRATVFRGKLCMDCHGIFSRTHRCAKHQAVIWMSTTEGTQSTGKAVRKPKTITEPPSSLLLSLLKPGPTRRAFLLPAGQSPTPRERRPNVTRRASPVRRGSR